METEQNRRGDQIMTSLGRNRLLGVLGAALFGLVVRAATPQAAAASPYGCEGASECPCCSGSQSCESGHTPNTDGACPGGGQCWVSYTTVLCNAVTCCDWNSPSYTTPCICAEYTPTC